MNFFEILLARYLGGGSGGGGSDIKRIELKVTENGKYIAPSGKAYSLVNVNVPIPVVEELNVSENGTYTAKSGKAYSPVNVNVPMPEGTLAIINNNTYNVASYEFVNVSVTSHDTELVPITIKNMSYYNCTWDYFGMYGESQHSQQTGYGEITTYVPYGVGIFDKFGVPLCVFYPSGDLLNYRCTENAMLCINESNHAIVVVPYQMTQKYGNVVEITYEAT